MFLLLILASEEKGIFQKEDKTLKKYFLENNLQGLILISQTKISLQSLRGTGNLSELKLIFINIIYTILSQLLPHILYTKVEHCTIESPQSGHTSFTAAAHDSCLYVGMLDRYHW
jgi:hypothetical protein